MSAKTRSRPDKIHRRGSIWEVDLSKLYAEEFEGLQTGNRPVLILSNNGFNQFSPSYNCAVLSCQSKESPVHVYCMLQEPSYILCEQLTTVPRKLLTNYYGILPPTTMDEVEAKLLFQLHLKGEIPTETLEDKKLLQKFKKMESNVLALVSGIGNQLESVQYGSPLSLQEKIDFVNNYDDKEFLMEYYGISSASALKAMYFRFKRELDSNNIAY